MNKLVWFFSIVLVRTIALAQIPSAVAIARVQWHPFVQSSGAKDRANSWISFQKQKTRSLLNGFCYQNKI